MPDTLQSQISHVAARTGAVLRDARIPSGGTITPEQHGATGDGIADDTAALNACIAAARPGQRIKLTGTYRHADVIYLNKNRVTLDGGGTLLAANPDLSSVWLMGNDQTMQDIAIRKTGVTQRYYGIGHMGLRIGSTTPDGAGGVNPVPADRALIRRVTIDGAAAAGVYLCGGSGWTRLEDVTVTGAWADGIHITEGAHHVKVNRPSVTGCGDDGVAVVSYTFDKAITHHVDVIDATITANTHSRGMTVIGGQDITYLNPTISGTCAAGIVIARETQAVDGYDTHACARVRIHGATLTDVNRGVTDGTGPDHGAVLIANSDPATLRNTDVTITSLTIHDSHNGFRVIGVYGSDNVTFRRVRFSGRRGQLLWHGDNLAAVTRSDVQSYETTLVEHGLATANRLTTPEGNLEAVPGSRAPLADGTLWLKQSGTGTTGWVKVGATTSGGQTPTPTSTTTSLNALMGA